MFRRDEEDRIVHELRSLRKSFSEDMLHQKCERKQFRAKPVPIESRIPLYDKILEDQAMRFTFSTPAHPVGLSHFFYFTYVSIFIFVTCSLEYVKHIPAYKISFSTYRASHTKIPRAR